MTNLYFSKEKKNTKLRNVIFRMINFLNEKCLTLSISRCLAIRRYCRCQQLIQSIIRSIGIISIVIALLTVVSLFFSSHIPWHRSLDQNSEYQKPRSTVFWFRYTIHTYQQHRIVNICNFVYMNVVKVCHFRARTHQSIKYMIYFITQPCRGVLFNVSPMVSVMKFLVFWLTHDVAYQ